MADYFAKISKPESELIFTILFFKAFKRFTGEALEPGETVFVERYDQGGMSSGMVDTNYWLEVVYPLLLGRYKIIRARRNN